MHRILAKTVGGLSASGYIRHFIFGLIFPVFMIAMLRSQSLAIGWGAHAMFTANCLLYPYSRHAYESIVGYIMGSNVFFTSVGFAMVVKTFTMALCWGAAIFIAPFGLLFLYFQNSREDAQ